MKKLKRVNGRREAHEGLVGQPLGIMRRRSMSRDFVNMRG